MECYRCGSVSKDQYRYWMDVSLKNDDTVK